MDTPTQTTEPRNQETTGNRATGTTKETIMDTRTFTRSFAILAVAAFILAAGAARAAIIVNPTKVQGTPTYSVEKTLMVIDVPTSELGNNVSITGPLGPDWTQTADDGFSILDGAQIYTEFTTVGNKPGWEPDGTSATGPRIAWMLNKPAKQMTWDFNLPDGAIVHNVYAAWGWQTNSYDGHTYSYDEGTLTTFTRDAGQSTGDLVLQWTDNAAGTHNIPFERIFAGDITVAGNDGFLVTFTQANTTAYPYVDAVVVDVTVLAPVNYFWDGGAGTWNTSTFNWNGGSQPWGWNTSDENTATFGNTGDAGVVTLAQNTTLADMTFNNDASYEIAGGGFNLNFDNTAARTIAANVDATISAPIGGSATISKTGAGILAITENAAQNYTGTMTVTEGTLDVSGAFGGDLIVDGTLSIHPTEAKTLNLGSKSLTLNDGATINWQFTNDGSYDQIISTAADLLGSGTITINVEGLSGYTVSKGDRFKLYDGDVSQGAFDGFTFVFEGTNKGYWAMELGSLDIVSTIPEPSTAILAGLGLMGVCFRRRRK